LQHLVVTVSANHRTPLERNRIVSVRFAIRGHSVPQLNKWGHRFAAVARVQGRAQTPDGYDLLVEMPAVAVG